MIIDCHGHYTTAPPQLGQYRDAQKAALAADPAHVGEKGSIDISDDELRESLEPNQLRLQRERGIDLTLFSPRASWMGHHIGNEHTSKFWTEHCNDLIRRICDLYPTNFAPVCQLPQSPGASIDNSVVELERCVNELGFIGANVNPDPTGGFWTGPPLWEEYWWPLWEKLCELDVPAMIHVSAKSNPSGSTRNAMRSPWTGWKRSSATVSPPDIPRATSTTAPKVKAPTSSEAPSRRSGLRPSRTTRTAATRGATIATIRAVSAVLIASPRC